MHYYHDHSYLTYLPVKTTQSLLLDSQGTISKTREMKQLYKNEKLVTIKRRYTHLNSGIILPTREDSAFTVTGTADNDGCVVCFDGKFE